MSLGTLPKMKPLWIASREIVCYSQSLCSNLNSSSFSVFVVLLHLISQLRPGADLSRVTFPTFILEPRSMLERITKYASLACSLFKSIL